RFCMSVSPCVPASPALHVAGEAPTHRICARQWEPVASRGPDAVAFRPSGVDAGTTRAQTGICRDSPGFTTFRDRCAKGGVEADCASRAFGGGRTAGRV